MTYCEAAPVMTVVALTIRLERLLRQDAMCRPVTPREAGYTHWYDCHNACSFAGPVPLSCGSSGRIGRPRVQGSLQKRCRCRDSYTLEAHI